MVGFGNPLLEGHDGGATDRVRRASEWQSCETVAAAQARTLRKRTAAGMVRTRDGAAWLQLLKAQSPLPETAYELCEVAGLLRADLQEVRLGARATEGEVKALNRAGRLADYKILALRNARGDGG